MATKKYGYNQYKPDGPAGMDIVDAELNRYSPAFDYLSGFVTRSKLKQVDDDRTGTSTGGGSTSGGSTSGGSTSGGSTVSNQFNPTINVTGGTQTQQTLAAGGDIRDSTQTNTASTTSTTTGSSNTIDTTGSSNTIDITGDGNGNNNNNNGGGNGDPKTCPAGKVGTPPNCTDPVADTCPPGKVGTPPNCTDPVVNTTRFSTSGGFETEQDAKNYITNYYNRGDVLGRAANFGTTTDNEGNPTDASYFLNKFADGSLTKADFERDVKLSSEFDEREDLKSAYKSTNNGRDVTEQELDAIMGTDTAANTANQQFLDNYKSLLEDTSADQTQVLSSAITSADDIVRSNAKATADEKAKYANMSEGVKDTYTRELTLGDLKKTDSKGDTIDQKIRKAYKNVFNRTPDAEGYKYWAKELAKEGNIGFDLEKSFKLSPEYITNFANAS